MKNIIQDNVIKGLISLLFVGLPCVSSAEEPATPAVWQKHEVEFQYQGFTSIYSCDGLADQLQRLLLLSGARADAKARPGICRDFNRPDRLASARLTFYTLAAGAGSSDETQRAQGQWRPVAIDTFKVRELQEGDCELVEEFRDRVLKKFFTIRDLKDSVSCIPHQVSGSRVSLSFEVLAPVAAAAPH